MVVFVASCGGADGGGGGGGGGGSQHPAWLSGSWSNGTRVENNTAFTGEEREIAFSRPDSSGSAKYRYRLGRSWTNEGRWSVVGDSIRLEGGYLSGRSISLSSFTVSCRILMFSGDTLFSSERIEGCPRPAARLSSDECRLVGNYSVNNQSGSTDVWSSNGWTLLLDEDRFYSYVYSHGSGRCFGTRCSSLTNSARPVVGEWRGSGGRLTAPMYDIASAQYEALEGSSCGGGGGGGARDSGVGSVVDSGVSTGALCGSCSSDADCPSGAFCGARRCDGVRGCYASGATCSTIAGRSCPAVSDFASCAGLTSSSCGSNSQCTNFSSGSPPGSRCLPRCASDADCRSSPSAEFDDRQQFCSINSGATMGICLMRCASGQACPSGASCRPFTNGTYGFCF
ncbi:MAG: hypothetical protein JNK05_30955 [Myxococcales bacterium]|nr:hypothetical protein [Myxococcales bacterium]